MPGIIQKLDYLKSLGIETIWCSPFFASPQQDFGYDISDYAGIASEYGKMADAEKLIEEAHRRGMKLLFDMVMNHTSIQHPWFKESRASRDNPKSDWYLWRDRPNNWQSVTGGSGWHHAPERGQYYWASFLPFQPDLNYRNPDVKQAMFDAVRFWLRKGVDGFRLDMINAIYKDAEFRDNPFALQFVPRSDGGGVFQRSLHSMNLPETFGFARELRKVCDEFEDRVLLGEVYGDRDLLRKFVGMKTNDGLTLVFDFGMLNFNFSADYFRKQIRDIEAHFPSPYTPVYVFSNHDQPRSIKRLGNDTRKAKLLHLMQLTLRGVACLYYGEEIGMTNARFPLGQALDPIPRKFKAVPHFVFDLLGMTINRDEVRTPMQWDKSANAGFSSGGRAWLPVNADFRTVNVEVEDRDPDSLLNTIREILKVRNTHPALQVGAIEWIESLPKDILGYRRIIRGEELAILLNFNSQKQELYLGERDWESLFTLSSIDRVKRAEILLEGFGGIILRKSNPA